MVFDYLHRFGPTTHTNAIRIIDFMAFHGSMYAADQHCAFRSPGFRIGFREQEAAVPVSDVARVF